MNRIPCELEESDAGSTKISIKNGRFAYFQKFHAWFSLNILSIVYFFPILLVHNFDSLKFAMCEQSSYDMNGLRYAYHQYFLRLGWIKCYGYLRKRQKDILRIEIASRKCIIAQTLVFIGWLGLLWSWDCALIVSKCALEQPRSKHWRRRDGEGGRGRESGGLVHQENWRCILRYNSQIHLVQEARQKSVHILMRRFQKL